jgi:hypothetical protein
MGYNDQKGWLDDQADTITELVALARNRAVSSREFTDSAEAKRFQYYIRNVLYGLAIHYPDYAEVCRIIRIWVDRDYGLPKFTVHVGTENNYTYRRRGKVAFKADQSGRQLPAPTIRGRPPQGPMVTKLETLIPNVPPPPEDKEITVCDELITEANWDEMMGLLQLVSNTAKTRALSLNHTDLPADATLRTRIEALDDWQYERSRDEGDRVTALYLIRRGD